MENKHTEGEWKVIHPVELSDPNVYIGKADNNALVCCLKGFYEKTEANAQFIVTACNSHYKLLEACEFTLTCITENWKDLSNVVATLKQAINRAKGGEGG